MVPEASAVLVGGGTREIEHEEDLALVAAVRRGDDRAFERLYRRYSRRVSSYALGMVKDHGRAEDITQEVFISALRRLRNCEQPIVLKPWLYEIARNACIDHYRRAQRTPEVSYEAQPVLGSGGPRRLAQSAPAPDDAVAIKQQLDHLQDAFDGLSSSQHDLLVMRELEGLSYSEISQRTGLTRPAVESGLFRARRRLFEEYTSLASGDRCLRIQRAIDDAAGGRPGTRERWRIARHVSHCAHCRRHAILAGLDLRQLRSLATRVAAFVPVPAFVRRWAETRAGSGPTHGPGAHVTQLAQWSATLGSAADPVLAGWATAGAAAAIALGLGAGGVDLGGGGRASGQRSSPAARHAAPAPGRAAPAAGASRHGITLGTRGPGGVSTGLLRRRPGHAKVAPAVTAERQSAPHQAGRGCDRRCDAAAGSNTGRRGSGGARRTDPAPLSAAAGGGDFLESLTETRLYSIGAYFCDQHPELVDDVVAQSEEIERVGLERYAAAEGGEVEATFQTLVTGLAIRYFKAVAGAEPAAG